MSHQDLKALEQILALVPFDWDLRLALIQAYVLHDQSDEAKRLVRESPDEAGPAPAHVQYRLHRLMVEGIRAAEEFAREDAASKGELFAEVQKNTIQTDPLPVRNAARHASGALEHPQIDGVIEATPSLIKVPSQDEGSALMKRSESDQRLQKLADSGFVLESADEFRPLEREPDAGRKVSALSFALLTHILLVFLLGAIVIVIPRPNPPQIVAVNVAQDRILDVPAKRVDKKVTPDRSAASGQASMVISSSAPSPVTVPEFEETTFTDVAVHLTDMKAGLGMSLEGEAEESEVNFFGIQSGGKKIAFIVDASPGMLVDEKGGMFAYDRVKDEVEQMLASLNRGTSFNILLYEGKKLKVYQSELVPARPSNVRLAIEWLDPLNHNYENLGLGRGGEAVAVSAGNEPIKSSDISAYAKATQLALEMDVNTIFCISGAYVRIARAPLPMSGKTTGTAAKVDPKDRKRWNQAVQKTREWLKKENAAREKNGGAPKVVTNFNALVRQVTGATPPRARGGSGGGRSSRNQAPYTAEEIEDHIKNLVSKYYREKDKALPQLNMVIFLGKGEDIGEYKDHFRRLTRRNKGKLKILEGLDALKDVTTDE